MSINLDSKIFVKYLDQNNQLYNEKLILNYTLKNKTCKFPEDLDAFNKSIC